MNKKIFKLSFLFLVIFVFGLFTIAHADTISYTVIGGTDTSSSTEKIFTQNDVSKLQASDSEPGNGIDRMGSDKWPDQNSYDESRYIEFLFNPSIPQNALISEVKITNEFQRSAALAGAKIEVWDNQSFVELNGTTLGTIGEDHTDIIDATSILNTPDKVNSSKIRFLAYRETMTESGTTTKHDFIELSVTYSIPEIPEPATFIIRNGDSVLYNDSVALPASGTVSINDANNVAHSVNARSVLAILKIIDDGSDAFAISNLQYYDSFSSFYLKCILPSTGTELCNNWLFTINNTYPPAIDTAILSGGETIYLYFGPQNKVILSSNSINTNDTLTVTAQKYDYQNNVWLIRTGVTVGLTQPNPDPNSWSPVEVQTNTVDENGQTAFSEIPVGSYNVGVKEDYYFPTESLTVSETPSGGGGGGGIPTAFDVQDALTYLKSAQSADGSFGGSLMYTDWAAIAFGALNVTDNYRDNILAYFNSNNAISPTLTDNERRAMALMALGQNPYSFNGVNYIYAITSSFDGAQFGDFYLVNDDIFALIPLANSGYTATDDIIIKNVAFIISKQNTNGSWEGNVDLTAAAIQALNPFESVAGVSGAINKAITYLQNAQGSDGGWENIYSTSWAMQAESALGASWSNGKTGLDYLATQQTNANNNGALLPSSATLQNNIWATSYAIAAASGKPWSEIMQSVPKPAAQNNSSANASENTNPQTLANPVICPKGDLFSSTTGQACTTTALIDSISSTEEIPSINSMQANSENTATPTPDTVLSNKKTNSIAANEIASSDLPANIDTPEIIPDTLTATAVKTLPTKTIPHAVPVVLGALSGLVLLYLVFKFLIVF